MWPFWPWGDWGRKRTWIMASDAEKDLILRLFDINAVKFGKFTLKSGIESPVYVDLRVIVSYPDVMNSVSEMLWSVACQSRAGFSLICGVPYTALPIASCMSVKHNVPMVMRRKEAKSYGTKKLIEGVFQTDSKCLVVEDVVTSGSSVLETVDALSTVGIQVSDAVVLLDRCQGGQEMLESRGVRLHSLFTLTKVIQVLHEAGRVTAGVVEQVSFGHFAPRPRPYLEWGGMGGFLNPASVPPPSHLFICPHPLHLNILCTYQWKPRGWRGGGGGRGESCNSQSNAWQTGFFCVVKPQCIACTACTPPPPPPLSPPPWFIMVYHTQCGRLSLILNWARTGQLGKKDDILSETWFIAVCGVFDQRVLKVLFSWWTLNRTQSVNKKQKQEYFCVNQPWSICLPWLTNIVHPCARPIRVPFPCPLQIQHLLTNQLVAPQVKAFLSANQFSVQSKPAASVPKTAPTFEERAALATHPMAKKLFATMHQKHTNLAVSADLTKSDDVLKLVELVGPHICLLKTHVDILEDFSPAFVKSLQELAAKYNFMIFEDRKFADIGNTVKLQYSQGIYHTSEWADIVNAHAVPGDGVISGLKDIGLALDRACLLIGEMSAEGNLATGAYTDATVAMAKRHEDFVIGFISLSRLVDDPKLVHLTPGVKLGGGGDSLGQQYLTPKEVISKRKSDVIIVGRGIYQADDPVKAAIAYKEAGFKAYLERTTNWRQVAGGSNVWFLSLRSCSIRQATVFFSLLYREQ